MAAMIQVNGVDISTPSNFSVSVNDIVKADRDGAGSMFIQKIATKRKIEMTWNFLSASKFSTLLTAVGASVTFSVNYPDPVTGTTRSGTFYVGDRSAEAMDYKNGVIRWKNVKFNFVEI